MAAENSLLLVINDGCEWHLFESFIDLCKNTVWVINVFMQSIGAFLSKTKISINVFIFMISSKQHNLLRILQFESEEQANDFKTVLSLVNVIS